MGTLSPASQHPPKRLCHNAGVGRGMEAQYTEALPLDLEARGMEQPCPKLVL